MDAFTWAHEEFWGAPLRDVRLRRRLVEVAACIRENPCGTLPRAIEGKAQLKGAYRLFSHPEVGHGQILHAHLQRTRENCRQPGEYLLIEDTTALSFTQRAPVSGMGLLTHEGSQGLLVHTCLAARIEQWNGRGKPEVMLAGLFAQECWARENPQGTRKERKKAKRRKTKEPGPRESDRWGRALRETGAPPAGTQWTLLADRECDIFEVLAQCANEGADWIIRAAQPRNTVLAEENVFEAAAQAPLLDAYTIPLRARPGVAARAAKVELRSVSTLIRPPGGLRSLHEPLPTGLVEVREVDPPENIEGIHWLLLTSWPCATAEQARRVAEAYSCRWLIEEYHKALKTGTNIEDSQLSTAVRIEALLAIHAVIAARLLQLKLLANTRPDDPVNEGTLEPGSITLLELKYGRPAGGWTNKTLMITIAKMGGYLARKNDGPPGWLSIWRGWLKLTFMTEGYLLATRQESYG